MTRHELHLEIQKISIEITIILTLCLVICISMLIITPSIMSNANGLFILGFAAAIHGIAFYNCMTNLLKERERLENELEDLDKKG